MLKSTKIHVLPIDRPLSANEPRGNEKEHGFCSVVPSEGSQGVGSLPNNNDRITRDIDITPRKDEAIIEMQSPAHESKEPQTMVLHHTQQLGLFMRYNLLSVLVLYLIYSVPLDPIDEMRLFNRAYWLFAANIAFEVPATMLYEIMMIAIILKLWRRYTDLKLLTKKIFVWFLIVSINFWVGMMCILSAMLSLDLFPIPFYGTILGSASIVFAAPLLMGLYLLLILKDLCKQEVMNGFMVFLRIWFFLFSVTLTEVPFLLGMYKSPANLQMVVVVGFQSFATLVKFLTRIFIRSSASHLGDESVASVCILLTNYFFEFILQCYVSIVSPRVIDSSTLILYLFFESMTLAFVPLIDSDNGRGIIKTVLKKLAPSKTDTIEFFLTIHTSADRKFSLTNCAMNFFVRVNASICSVFLGVYVYYGYNRDAFVTSDNLSHSEFIGSMLFSCSSGAIAIVQYEATRRILCKVYHYDMHELWFSTLQDNFIAFLSVPALVFVHIATSILHIYYSLSFVLNA